MTSPTKRTKAKVKAVRAWAALNEDGSIRFVAHPGESRDQVQSWCSEGMKVIRVEIVPVPARRKK